MWLVNPLVINVTSNGRELVSDDAELTFIYYSHIMGTSRLKKKTPQKMSGIVIYKEVHFFLWTMLYTKTNTNTE